MESPDPSQRGVYFPMELLPREILQRLGNVRVLVVPKERSSSSKENEEESFGKKEDRNLYDGPPLSPSVNYRQMGQSFDFRLTSPEGERYPMKERQEVEMMKSMAENTPKRRAQEPTKTSVRFENNVGDERQSTNQSPATIQEGSHPNESGSQGKIKRRLFSDFEADYRAVRNESENSDEVFVDRQRGVEKMSSRYYTVRDPQGSNQGFDREFAPSQGWRSCPPLAPYANQPRFEFGDYQQRQQGGRCEGGSLLGKRRFSESSALIENKKHGLPKKRSFCTCSCMEQSFLKMAECAYKNIRRKDTSPSSFDQFRLELIQTNNILKESVGLVETIREMCEHNRQLFL